jgi:hypothetical protein
MKTKHKHSRWLLCVVAISLTLSWLSLYDLGRGWLHMPALAAAGISLAFDLGALGLAQQSLRQIEAGESAVAPNLVTMAEAAISAYANAEHAILSRMPMVGAVVLGSLPLLALAMFEVDVRFVRRQIRRAEGKASAPMPTFSPLHWLFFRDATAQAFKTAILHRDLTPEQAMNIGLALTGTEHPALPVGSTATSHADAPDNAVLARVTTATAATTASDSAQPAAISVYIGGSKDDLEIRGLVDKATAGASNPVTSRRSEADAVVTPRHDAERALVAVPSARQGDSAAPSVAELVRQTIQAGTTDRDTILSVVQQIRPDVQRQTVVRAIQRQAAHSQSAVQEATGPYL